MEEKVGSYVKDANDNLVPNKDDEAMAERHGLKTPKKGSKNAAQGFSPADAKKEVTGNVAEK